MTRIQANLVLLLAGVIWGMGLVAQSTATASIGPFMFIAIRSVIASFTILPMALAEGRSAEAKLKRSEFLSFGLIGLALFTGLSAQQIGLITTSVTNAGFLTALYLIIVPVLGIIIFRRWPHPIIWPCSLGALVGIFLLSGGAPSALETGDWLVVFGAFFWALQVLLIDHAKSSKRPITLSCVQFATSAVAGFMLAAIRGELDVSAIPLTWKELLFTGMFSSGAAFTLQAIGQRYTTAPQAAIFLLSEALFAAFFAAIFLGERLPAAGLFGCALIFACMLAVEIVPMLRVRGAAASANR